MPYTNVIDRGTHGIASGWSQEVWAKEILIARRNKLTLAEHVDRRDQDVAKYGVTLNVARRSLQTANTIAPGAEIDTTITTESRVQIQLTTQAYHSFLVPDVMQMQSRDDLEQYVEESAYAIARKVDSDLMTLATGAGITQQVGSTANTTTRLAKTFFTQANALLDVANAPEEDRYVAVEANGYKQILDIDDFVKFDASGGKGIKNGKVGEVYGLMVIKTQQVSTVQANVMQGLVWHKSGLILAMQKEETVKSDYILPRLSTQFAVYNVYGANIGRTDHMVKVAYGIG